MIRTVCRSFTLFAVLCMLATGWAQRRHDPLNDAEIDQLRETAQEPQQRMKLYIKFAKARMEAIEQARNDPKLMETGSAMRTRLEDLATLVDEIDDNLDQFNGRSQDLRKPLKTVVEMDADFQAKLADLKKTSTPAQLKSYGFELESAIDSVNESADSAKALLEDQLSKRGAPKDNPKEDKEDKPAKGHDDGIKPPCSPC